MKILLTLYIILTGSVIVMAQQPATGIQWIRPADEKAMPMWGLRNGIVVGLWPASIEKGDAGGLTGGPRGLLRIGYEYMGSIYLINFIAVEPVVNDEMEFSEVSASEVDGALGKFFWAADDSSAGHFSPYASARGIITHPDKMHPDVEALSLYVLMEKFTNGAHPFLRLTIRSDRAEEVGIEIFNHEKSVLMERCALTATMGNYSKLRLLYLKKEVVDSRKLFAGYKETGFMEKEPYAANQMLRNKTGDFYVVAEPNESLGELSAWPQEEAYLKRWGWRYRPFYKLSQYWRVPMAGTDSSSLQVRVNGRAKYWAGDSPDKNNYIDIPGGPAFENFELRERYHSGQQFYFGLSRKTAQALISDF